MDDAGITFRVLSNSGAGPDLVPGPDGVILAQKVNDALADVVVKNSSSFAPLPPCRWRAPDACATELKRAR